MTVSINLFTGNIEENVDTHIVIYNREDYKKVKEVYKNFKFFPDFSLSARWDDNFFDVAIFSKLEKPSYNSVKLLRNVLCPYVKDGEPRGWFRGPDGRPQRYTGISNSLFLSKSPFDKDFSAPFLMLIKMMYTNCNDIIKSNIEDMDIVNNPTPEFEEYTKVHFIYDK